MSVDFVDVVVKLGVVANMIDDVVHSTKPYL